MARTDHGLSLTVPVLKPGTSRFQITQSGFDTGSRTFTVDADSLATVIPTRETPDIDLRWKDRTNTTISGRYPKMYVSDVSIGEERNNLVEFTVSLLGLLKDNKPFYEEVQTQTTPFKGEDEGNPVTGFYDSLPVVTRTYVTTTRPNLQQLGQNIIPSGWGEPLLQITVLGPGGTPTTITLPGVKAAYWVLRDREQRQAGPLTNGTAPLYEVRDQYAYEVHR